MTKNNNNTITLDVNIITLLNTVTKLRACNHITSFKSHVQTSIFAKALRDNRY